MIKELLQRSRIWPVIAGAGVAFTALVAFTIVHRSFLVWALIIFIVVMLVIALLLWLRLEMLKQESGAHGLEDTLSTQADSDIEQSRPGTVDEAANQRAKRELLEGIQLHNAGSRRGSRALASDPLYLVLGPADSGKSELIKRSGLDFTNREAGRDAKGVRGVGGTRAFTWWFCRDAMLLDMGGRAMETADFADPADWNAFLEQLLKNRAVPLNGVMVVVSLDQIADQPEGRIDTVARQVRDRIEELEDKLGRWFPVYVMFNRCDRLAGFDEFFENMLEDERRQAWGATIRLERARKTRAQHIFDDEMNTIVSALCARRMARVAELSDRASRARAFAFPLQVERVRGSMRRFIRTLFEFSTAGGARGTDRPFLRGFYLCAATNGGEPVDRVLQPAVSSLGLKVPAPQGFAPAQSSAWFAQRVFQDVVFRDAQLNGTSHGERKYISWQQKVSIAIFATAWLVLTIVVISLAFENFAVLDKVGSAAQKVNTSAASGAALDQKLSALDELAMSVDDITAADRSVGFGRWLGGWSGGPVRVNATSLWATQLSSLILREATAKMEARLRDAIATPPSGMTETYYTYVARYMLNDPKGIVAADSLVLTHSCLRALEERLDQVRLGHGLGEPGGRLVRRQMSLLARLANDYADVRQDAKGVMPGELAENAARLLVQYWSQISPLDLVLADIPTGRYSAVGFGQLVSKPKDVQCAASVRGAFTEAAWHEYVLPSIQALDGELSRCEPLTAAFNHAGMVRPQLGVTLEPAYFAVYSQSWVAMLNAIEFNAPRDSKAVSDLLTHLSEGGSDVDRLLVSVQAYTGLPGLGGSFSLLPRYTGADGDKTGGLREWIEATFSSLKKKQDSPGTPRGGYRELLKKTKLILDSQATNGALSAAASLEQEFSQYEQVLRQNDPNYDAHPGNLAVSAMLKKPIQLAADVIIGPPPPPQVWRDSIVTSISGRLAGKFPFSPGVAAEIPLADFDAIFSPDGAISRFMRQWCGYLNADGSAKPGYKVPISPNAQEFFRKAMRIQKAFYPQGSNPSIQIQVEWVPIQGASGTQIYGGSLRLGNQEAKYTGANDTGTLSWPVTGSEGTATLRLLARKHGAGSNQWVEVNVIPQVAGGAWGLFRLLDGASDRTPSNAGVEATWSLSAGGTPVHVTMRLTTSAQFNPLAPSLLRNLTPPDSPL